MKTFPLEFEIDDRLEKSLKWYPHVTELHLSPQWVYFYQLKQKVMTDCSFDCTCKIIFVCPQLRLASAKLSRDNFDVNPFLVGKGPYICIADKNKVNEENWYYKKYFSESNFAFLTKWHPLTSANTESAQTFFFKISWFLEISETSVIEHWSLVVEKWKNTTSKMFLS